MIEVIDLLDGTKGGVGFEVAQVNIAFIAFLGVGGVRGLDEQRVASIRRLRMFPNNIVFGPIGRSKQRSRENHNQPDRYNYSKSGTHRRESWRLFFGQRNLIFNFGPSTEAARREPIMETLKL